MKLIAYSSFHPHLTLLTSRVEWQRNTGLSEAKCYAVFTQFLEAQQLFRLLQWDQHFFRYIRKHDPTKPAVQTERNYRILL